MIDGVQAAIKARDEWMRTHAAEVNPEVVESMDDANVRKVTLLVVVAVTSMQMIGGIATKASGGRDAPVQERPKTPARGPLAKARKRAHD